MLATEPVLQAENILAKPPAGPSHEDARGDRHIGLRLCKRLNSLVPFIMQRPIRLPRICSTLCIALCASAQSSAWTPSTRQPRSGIIGHIVSRDYSPYRPFFFRSLSPRGWQHGTKRRPDPAALVIAICDNCGRYSPKRGCFRNCNTPCRANLLLASGATARRKTDSSVCRPIIILILNCSTRTGSRLTSAEPIFLRQAKNWGCRPRADGVRFDARNPDARELNRRTG